jgi:broad specificity phosphatase PhoE
MFDLPVLHAQSNTNQTSEVQFIYLVRHAEKADDGTNDPPLTNVGEKRSHNLSSLLRTSDIGAIYSSDFKRTRSTAAPLANELRLRIKIYDPKGKDIQEEIKSTKTNMLIVGHSNSTPALVNAILNEEKYPALDESEYDFLYILCKIGNHFGASTTRFKP